jgi:hypothetical protein
MKMREIKMLVGLSGDQFSWAPTQVVEVEESLAIAFCTEPADAPRAEAIGWDPFNPDAEAPTTGKARLTVYVESPEPEPQSKARLTVFVAEPAPESGLTAEEEAAKAAAAESVEGETREEETMETATAPAQEKRETATQKRTKKTPKPPKPAS